MTVTPASGMLARAWEGAWAFVADGDGDRCGLSLASLGPDMQSSSILDDFWLFSMRKGPDRLDDCTGGWNLAAQDPIKDHCDPIAKRLACTEPASLRPLCRHVGPGTPCDAR